MRKIIAALVALIAAGFIQVNEKPILSGADGNYDLYVGTASSQCKIVPVEKELYERGDYDRTGVTGVSVSNVDADFVKKEIEKLNAKLVFTEHTQGVVIKYYYSTKISAYKRVNGKKVNLQTAERADSYTIGSPLIFGGF